MPLIYKEILENDSILAIWKTEESENQIVSDISGYEFQINEINQIKAEGRRKEKLATLLLLKTMGINSFPIYDDNGKPSLNDSSKNLSISHSQEYLAVLVSSKNCSVDIEINSDRVNRISSKFMNHQEEIIVANDLRNLQLVWSAKETAYKLLPSKGIDFKEHMKVTMIDEVKLTLEYSYLGNNQLLSMNYELHEKFQIVYAFNDDL